jgi:SAM-dependent methyltransferase
VNALREAEFDAYAARYESALQEGLRVSGEDSAYFARGRIECIRDRLAELGAPARTVVDFGCGTGSATPLLLDILGAERVIGTDVSHRLLDRARTQHGSGLAEFCSTEQALEGWADVVHCNGVFHHIPPHERPSSLEWVRRALRPGGLFAFWENNPWNPGTRLVMRRIEFDRDAVMLTPHAAREMLTADGFEILRTQSLFYFPRTLRALRRYEPRLANVVLGAQYLVLARRSC